MLEKYFHEKGFKKVHYFSSDFYSGMSQIDRLFEALVLEDKEHALSEDHVIFMNKKMLSDICVTASKEFNMELGEFKKDGGYYHLGEDAVIFAKKIIVDNDYEDNCFSIKLKK